jgi:hypothetical protein
LPPSPSPLWMSKTENKDAATIKNVASTKCLPGQIRLPNPNSDTKTGSSRKLPSAFRNRSGLKISGSGYKTGLCKIALKKCSRYLRTMGSLKNITHHAFPIANAPRKYAWAKIRHIHSSNRLTLWYEEACIHVVFRGCMWDTCQ